MSHRYIITFAILTVILMFDNAIAQDIVVNNHWSHPEEMEEGESVGIDVMQYRGEILTFVADGGNGLVVLTEDDQGDLVVRNHWAHPEDMEEGEAIDVTALEYGGELVVFVADGANSLVMLREDDEGDLVLADHLEMGDYAMGVATVERWGVLFILVADGANGMVVAMLDEEGNLANYSQWPQPGEGESMAVDILALEGFVYIYIANADGVVLITVDNEANAVESDYWVHPEDIEGEAEDVKALEYDGEILVFVADGPYGVVILSQDEEGHLSLSDSWAHPEDMEAGEARHLDVYENEDGWSVYVADGENGMIVLTEDDEGNLTLDNHWIHPEEMLEMGECQAYDVTIFELEDGLYSHVADGYNGLVILSEEEVRAPHIIVDPLAIELFGGLEIDEEVVNVANIGNEMLSFSIEHEILEEPELDADCRSLRLTDGSDVPRRDDLGDIIDQFNVGEGFFTGLAWDGELMWGVDYDGARMVGGNVNMELLEVELPVEEAEVDGFTGMCWDGDAFWFGCVEQEALYCIDIQGNLLGSFELPAGHGEGAFSVTWDGECLWFLRGDIRAGSDPIMRRVTVEGELVRSVSVEHIVENSDSDYWCIVWVPSHIEGNMWLLGGEQWSIHQLNVDGEEAQVLQEAELNHNEAMFYGIGHNGSNLWYCDEEGNWCIMDDGTEEHYWLMYEPDEGELGPGEDMDIIVTLDVTGCLAGDYEADLHFLSNDPNDPDVVVNVLMHVDGAPDIDVEWPEELGYPDVIDWDLAWFPWPPYEIPVTVMNVGTDDLEVANITCDIDEFTAEPTEFVLAPREEMDVVFTFNLEEGGEYNGVMTLFSNDPNEEEFEINLHAMAFNPPVIVVSPERLEFWLPGGGDENSINISNEGDALLRFVIECEFFDEPGQDDAVRNLRRTDGLDGAHRDDPGDILLELVVGEGYWAGLAWDGNLIWGVDAFGGRMIGVSPEGDVIEDVELPIEEIGVNLEEGALTGMCWDGEAFWIGCYGLPELFRIDRGGNLLSRFELPVHGEEEFAWGVAWDGQNLWYNLICERAGVLYQVSTEGDLIREVSCQGINGADMMSIVWVPQHDDGHIWAVSCQEHIFYQLNVEGDHAEIVQQIQRPVDRDAFGIGHDGNNLWFQEDPDFAFIWYVMDDGISEHYWLMYEPAEGEIEDGEDMDIIITLDAAGLEDGDYEAELHIFSNDPVNPEVIVPVIMHLGLHLRRLVDFEETGNFHLLMITDLVFDHERAPSGWEIGAFTPDEVLSGAAVWIENQDVDLRAYGAAEGIDQFEGGDEFLFRVWDPEADREYPAQADFQEGPEVWNPDSESILSLAAFSLRTLTIRLFRGWNMISINIIPVEEYWEREEGPDVILMFEQLRVDNDYHYVEVIKDERGNFYSPAWFNFNNIPYWNLEQGFLVKIDSDMEEEFVEVSWTGTLIPADAPIHIDPGWHIIAYYPDYELDASRPDFYVLSPIIDFVGIAKDKYGHFMVPAWNYSDMDPWRPTQGYQIRIDNDDPVVLVYPPEQEGVAFVASKTKSESHWAAPLTTGENMSVLVASVNGLQVEDDDQIAAYNLDDRLVGVGKVQGGLCGLAVWGDDPTTEKVDGLKAGEAFNLRIWDVDRELELNLATGTILNGNGLVYSANDFMVLDVTAQTAIPDEYYLSQNFSNPFNSVTKLTYGLPDASHVAVQIYDVAGRLVTTLVSTDLEAGHHAVVWDASGLPSGVYMCHLSAGNYFATRKLVLLR